MATDLVVEEDLPHRLYSHSGSTGEYCEHSETYEGDICQYRNDDTGAPYEEIGMIHWASGCFAFGNTPLCELTFTNDRLPLTVIGHDVEHAEILETGAGHPGGLSCEFATPC
jgi:hypothetical protein